MSLCVKTFVEKLNEHKVDDNGITTMEKFAFTTTYITIKNHHKWGCPVYFLDAIFHGNIAVLPKWETDSHAGIYLDHSIFHAVSVSLVINSETSHISPQYYVFFNDDFPQLYP